MVFTSDGNFYLEVLVDDRSLFAYAHNGEWFIEGTIGRSFTLRVGKRDYGRRALAVISIDGLSIHDGKPAHSGSRGYVLERDISSITIPGWRLNEREVAAFDFARLPKAYASQMGKPENIGVIGAKFWYEEGAAYPPAYESSSTYNPPSPLYPPPIPDWSGPPDLGSAPYGAPPAPGSAPPPAAPSAVPRSPGVGTGFGRRMDHRVTNVSFQRDESTRQLLVLRYDTAANLEARGITLLRTSEDRVMQANPFPGDDNGCPPPPGWSGF